MIIRKSSAFTKNVRVRISTVQKTNNACPWFQRGFRVARSALGVVALCISSTVPFFLPLSPPRPIDPTTGDSSPFLGIRKILDERGAGITRYRKRSTTSGEHAKSSALSVGSSQQGAAFRETGNKESRERPEDTRTTFVSFVRRVTRHLPTERGEKRFLNETLCVGLVQ